ncbi:hypothetical protein Pcinc_034541 [Petrolisthes cinctipes]|uniref:Uncharacterized protein n=1 Tax=Petrolisthes cinctipes TaxID=88211 RepID=A0AAE1C1D4_PETCI|nr:hypothetical protein Pcinc_034541 [Petrolisthes cinctipes]
MVNLAGGVVCVWRRCKRSERECQAALWHWSSCLESVLPAPGAWPGAALSPHTHHCGGRVGAQINTPLYVGYVYPSCPDAIVSSGKEVVKMPRCLGRGKA